MNSNHWRHYAQGLGIDKRQARRLRRRLLNRIASDCSLGHVEFVGGAPLKFDVLMPRRNT